MLKFFAISEEENNNWQSFKTENQKVSDFPKSKWQQPLYDRLTKDASLYFG